MKTPDFLLVIDDNESIHRDFEKIFAACEQHDTLSELDADLFGASDSGNKDVRRYVISFASQGRSGLEVLKQAKDINKTFGAAFIDMRMPPGWDGVETIEQLWKIDPDLQVVICTAYSDRSWDEIIERLGRNDKLLILKKPFDEIEVVQLASSLTEKRRLLDESTAKMTGLEGRVDAQQAELVTAQNNAETLIDSIRSVLISLDEKGVVSRWNQVAEQLFGIPVEEAVGCAIKDLKINWSSPSQLAELLDDDAHDEAKQPLYRQAEIQFADGKGVLHTLDFACSRIANGPSSKARLILASDITRQRSMQAQLDQAHRMESVGQLAAGVAHEINTPMQYIGDNIRFVSKSFEQMGALLDCVPAIADPESTMEQIELMRKTVIETVNLSKIRNSIKQIPGALSDSIEGVEAVSKIVAAMKEFSHPGTDNKSAVCLNHVLESTITVARNEWKYVAEIETVLADDVGKIDGLPGELNQAFLNIIVNASHAMADRVRNGDYPKGLLKIETKAFDDMVEVRISDNGGGIPAAARDRVFEPFFTTKAVGKGTGQGLAIAHAVIARKHQGKLWFDVEEGVGTTFTIQLPRISFVAAEPNESTFCATS